MNKSILVLTIALQSAAVVYTAPVYAQDAKDSQASPKTTGESGNAWKAGRAVGHTFGQIGDGFEWLGRHLFHWGKTGSRWIAHEAIQGADAVWDGSKWVAHKTVDGSKWLAGETKDLAQYGACLTVKGAKVTWRDSKKVGRVVGRSVKEGTIFMVEGSQEFGRGTVNNDSKNAENKAAREARKAARQAALEEPSKLPSCGTLLKEDDSKPEVKSTQVAANSAASEDKAAVDSHEAVTAVHEEVANTKPSAENVVKIDPADFDNFDLDFVQRSPAVTDTQAKVVDTSSDTLRAENFDFGKGGCLDADAAY